MCIQEFIYCLIQIIEKLIILPTKVVIFFFLFSVGNFGRKLEYLIDMFCNIKEEGQGEDEVTSELTICK